MSTVHKLFIIFSIALSRISFLLILNSIITCDSQFQATPLKSVRLSPLNTADSGATISTQSSEVTPTPTQWNINAIGHDTWHIITTLNNSFGFHPTKQSIITFQLNSPTIPGSTFDDLLYAFTVPNTNKFIGMTARMGGNTNRIVPDTDETCPTSGSTSLANGNVIDLVSTGGKGFGQRSSHLGLNFGTYDSLVTIQSGAHTFPIEFILTNKPLSNQMEFIYKSVSGGLIQQCVYQSFDTSQGIQIYFAVNRGGEQCNITFIDITYSYQLTYAPTMDESNQNRTKNPSSIPTSFPTKTPTNLPSIYPSTIPTKSQTKIPTQLPSNNPPKFIPTATPISSTTQSPNPVPTATSLPTKTPTKIPTQLPSNNPPTFMPTATPISSTIQSADPVPTATPTFLSTASPISSTIQSANIDWTETKSIYTSTAVEDLNDSAANDETFVYVLYIGLVIICLCICCLCFMICKSVYKYGKQVETTNRLRIPSFSVQKQLQNSNGNKSKLPKLVNTIKTSVSLKKAKCIKNEYIREHEKDMVSVQSVSMPQYQSHMVHSKYSLSVEPCFTPKLPNDEFFNVIRAKRSVSEYSKYSAQEIYLWLKTEVHLPQYYGQLIENGYDTLEMITSMESKSCLDEIGIQLKGHKNKLWVEIKKLKINNGPPQNTFTPSVQQNNDDNNNDELYEKENVKMPSTKDAQHMVETFDTPGEGL